MTCTIYILAPNCNNFYYHRVPPQIQFIKLILSKMVRDKTVLTYHKIYIPSIYIFYIMCVSSILIAVVLCLYSKISVVVVNIFFPVGFFFPCKNNCCIIPINLKLLISLLSNLLVIYPTASAYYL